MDWFRERRGQSLDKFGQTRSNLKNGPETTRLYEIQIQILIIGFEKYCDLLVLVKFVNNWIVRLREHCDKGTQHTSITHHR